MLKKKKSRFFSFLHLLYPKKTYTCRFGIRCRCHSCVCVCVCGNWLCFKLHKRQYSMFTTAYFSLWFFSFLFLFIFISAIRLLFLFVCSEKCSGCKKTAKQNCRSPISFKLIVKPDSVAILFLVRCSLLMI